MKNIKDIDNLDDYIVEYYNKWSTTRYGETGYIEYLTKIFHLLLIVIILTGPFLPHQILPYYIIGIIFLVLSWHIFDGCVLTKPYGNKQLVPLSDNRKGKMLATLLLFAIIGFSYKPLSLYNIIKSIIDYLDQYN